MVGLETRMWTVHGWGNVGERKTFGSTVGLENEAEVPVVLLVDLVELALHPDPFGCVF